MDMQGESRAKSLGSALMPAAAYGKENLINPKIIKTGRISLSTDGVVEAKTKILALLPQYKAFVLTEDEGRSPENLYVSLTIKVPAEHFDSLVKGIVESGLVVESKSVSLSDVTEQYIDLETRLKNKKVLIEKYNTLLSKSQKLADTIEINRQLEAVTSELESLEGQMKYLNNQIDLSSVELTITQKLAPTEQNEKSFFSELKYHFNAGMKYFREAVLFVLALWPFIVLAGLAVFLYRRFKKP